MVYFDPSCWDGAIRSGPLETSKSSDSLHLRWIFSFIQKINVKSSSMAPCTREYSASETVYWRPSDRILTGRGLFAL
jgi:hypothetical protein